MIFDGLVNLSLGKRAKQSSTLSHAGHSLYDASKALSGVGQGYAFHSTLENSPWWQVDLENVYPIHYIVIGNRQGTCQEKAITMAVETSSDGAAWEIIHTGLVCWDGDLIWPLGGRVSARFVRLSLKEKNYLHLAKVEVWGAEESVVRPGPETDSFPWAETEPDGLKELSAVVVEPSGPDELVMDLAGDIHCVWAFELIAPASSVGDFFKNLRVESSVDGRDWQTIHEGLLFGPQRLYWPLRGEIIARFFRFTFPGESQPERVKVKFFSRVYTGLKVYAVRADGSQSRMIALLCAIYMAKLLNCDLKVYWNGETRDVTDDGTKKFYIPSGDRIFSADFLLEHSIETFPEEFSRLQNMPKLGTYNNLSHRELLEPGRHDLPGIIVAPCTELKRIFNARLTPPISYYKSLFDSIDFSPDYVKIIDMVKRLDLPAGFSAIHFRCGDVIYNRVIRAESAVHGKTLPLQLVKMTLEKLKKESREVILFSEDAEVSAYLAGVYGCKLPADYLPAEGFAPDQRDFFEMYLMSRASQIYSCRGSAFSYVPSLIGSDIEAVDMSGIATSAEIISYIESDLDKNENIYHPLHNSFSLQYLYHLIHLTDPKRNQSLLVEKMVHYDKDNATVKLLRSIEYFKASMDQPGEKILHDLFCFIFDYNKMSISYSHPYNRNYLFTIFCHYGYFKPLQEAAARGNVNAAAAMFAIFHEVGQPKYIPEYVELYKNLTFFHKLEAVRDDLTAKILRASLATGDKY